VALRHQLAVLRRQRPGRPKLRSIDRLTPNPSSQLMAGILFGFWLNYSISHARSNWIFVPRTPIKQPCASSRLLSIPERPVARHQNIRSQQAIGSAMRYHRVRQRAAAIHSEGENHAREDAGEPFRVEQAE
jgi:hypothetical protein